MKDINGNKITEHEFTKDIGHRTEYKFGLCTSCNTMKNLPIHDTCSRCYFDLPINDITKTTEEIVENLKVK